MPAPRPVVAALLLLPLAGCVAGMVAGAAGMAAREAQGRPQSNAALAPQARAACTARAAPLGTVAIIDVVQDSVDRLTVWGTVTGASGRQSFECRFTTAITAFKLRPIPARAGSGH
ncbi:MULTISPECIES: hypothetical protein [Sphingomonas]|uniref:hypothetical protein n=1 Tax=Sphingomonas TaxID=13687 RepID=UPI000DEED755|nr:MULTISPECIES: hypothetical protein [Sphingomonas]